MARRHGRCWSIATVLKARTDRGVAFPTAAARKRSADSWRNYKSPYFQGSKCIHVRKRVRRITGWNSEMRTDRTGIAFRKLSRRKRRRQIARAWPYRLSFPRAASIPLRSRSRKAQRSLVSLPDRRAGRARSAGVTGGVTKWSRRNLNLPLAARPRVGHIRPCGAVAEWLKAAVC